MNVAVIGAGWTGLAAALALRDAGVHCTVFEAAPLPGGRARRVDDKNMGAIDNGQHLMLGAYTQTLKLIRSLNPGVPEAELLLRLPLQLESASGEFRMRAPTVMAPLHGLLAIMWAHGLSIRDKWYAIRMVTSLRKQHWSCPPLQTVSQLLNRHHQTSAAILRLWQPLCLASLNTPIEQACAQLFLNVLRDSLDAPAAASDMLVPRVDLTRLWPAAAAQQLMMRYRHIVSEVLIDTQHVEVDGESFEACIIATPPYAASRILRVTHNPQALDILQQQLQAFTYRPIATLTMQLEQDWRMPCPLMMLDEFPEKGHYGQWVFACAASNQLTIVVSDASDFLKHDRQTFVAGIAQQIREQIARHPRAGHPMPAVLAHRLIVEKRATFSAEPGVLRPANSTAWPRLALAGDWTDTGYPAVLEGAVQSGQAAARAVIELLA